MGEAMLLPAMPDTDTDGTGDTREASDRDGQTNLQEQSLGTDPLKADTDDDGWSRLERHAELLVCECGLSV